MEENPYQSPITEEPESPTRNVGPSLLHALWAFPTGQAVFPVWTLICCITRGAPDPNHPTFWRDLFFIMVPISLVLGLLVGCALFPALAFALWCVRAWNRSRPVTPCLTGKAFS